MSIEQTNNGPAIEDASKGDKVDTLEIFANRAVGLPAEETGESAAEEMREGEIVSPEGAGQEDEQQKQPSGPPNPLQLVKSCYGDSTEYMQANLTGQWEAAERAFQGRHPPGSKYLSAAYKQRSSLYRPKTRAMIRQGEAQAAASYFSNEDVVVIKPVNENSKENKASAELIKEILQYRLTTPSPRVAIPWFMTVIGAYQDAEKNGIVASKQYWEYEERVDTEIVQVGQTREGVPMYQRRPKRVVIKDRPRCDLIPPELIRIDRGADWRDPINSSPFCIIQIPMYLQEVEDRMKKPDPTQPGGDVPWLDVDRTTLLKTASMLDSNTTRQEREANRQDPKASTVPIDDFKLVCVHENFVRWGRRDWHYFTAGTEALLSEPRPVEEVYKHAKDGERPVVMGLCIIEAHKTFPSGKPAITADLQREANEIVNLRLDNVKLAMNKRFLVKRGRQVDLRSLTRSVPGSITLVNDVDGDVKEIEVRDVTASSYQEQNLLNNDFDDLAGVFSPGSVNTNRRLNETVGGMQLLSGTANNIAELDLRAFNETWAEKVLGQFVNMIRHYESDTTIIAIAADKARLFQRYGVDRINDQLMNQELSTRINVGIGATDPMQRLNKFAMASKILGQIFGDKLLPFLDMEEVVKEVMAPLGFRDGDRFFNFGDQDPIVQILMKQIEALQGELDKRTIEREGKIEVARLGAVSRVIQQYVENQGKQQEIGLQFINDMRLRGFEAANEIMQTREEADREDMRMRQDNLTTFALEAQRGRTAMRQRRMEMDNDNEQAIMQRGHERTLNRERSRGPSA